MTRVTTPRVPKADAAPAEEVPVSRSWKPERTSRRGAPSLPIQLMVASKAPWRKELLSPDVPEKPPPAVMLGN